MKYSIMILFFFQFQLTEIFSQSSGYNTSAWCHRNVYDPVMSGTDRKECIDATFKFQWNTLGGGTASCTGTLINRNTDDDDVGFYFLTARHCFQKNSQSEYDMDPSQEIDFYFNFQSKNEHNADVPLENRGTSKGVQSNLYNNSLSDNNDYQYHHRSRIQIISAFVWGDFMLCKIETPLPPHFNITYAGWSPSPFRLGEFNWGNFSGIHHPSGDIKKISETQRIIWAQNPIATGCYTVTKLIDVLVGWLWRRRWSTSVICNYIDNPYFFVPSWTRGTTEGGSSGSGMFLWTNNRTIGTLTGLPWSGNVDPCVLKQDAYGKLSANYNNAKVKTTMNPFNSLQVDLFGMPSRKIKCYPNLDLPGEPGVSGEYFPAQDYQSENTITLQAVNNITTNAPINVYPNADYRFRAGNTIVLDNGFDARNGSMFIAEIGGCQTQTASKPSDPTGELLNALSQITIPKRKYFDMNQYVEGSIRGKDQLFVNIFPNPTNGIFTIKLSVSNNYNVKVCNSIGDIVYSRQIQNSREHRADLSGVAAGTYFVYIDDGREKFVSKLVVYQ